MNLFPYPGNKAQHADWVSPHFPAHTCYVEVFGGAAGVLFNKEPSTVEIYNDLDGDIVQFFEVLRDSPGDLKEWLERVPYARELHERWATEFYNGERCDDPVERAGRFFYLRYTQWGGKYYGKSGFATRKTKNGAVNLTNKVERLGEFSDRLRNVVVESESWQQMFQRYDGDETLFYLDPPYDGTEYQYDSGGFDHRNLYKTIDEAEGYCCLSYDSVPGRYKDDYEIRSEDSGYKIDNADGDGTKDATEYLIMNYDPDETARFVHAGQVSIDELF